MANLFVELLFWYFVQTPKKILAAWANFLKFNLNFFSIGPLLKTLFSPWRQYYWTYGRGFDIGRYIQVFFSNIVTRLIGATIRSVVVVVGLLVEIFILAVGPVVLAVWFLLPVFCVWSVKTGITMLFSS
jgi:hypothetical protein